MIKSMVLDFCLLGVDAILDNECRTQEHLQGFREVKCLQGYSKTLWMGV